MSEKKFIALENTSQEILSEVKANMAASEASSKEILDAIKTVQDFLDLGDPPRYGVCINKSESDPSKRVIYLGAARNMRAAHMNFSTGVFDYGDWENIWFVKKNRPCMVKQATRQVDYYLNPNDYSKKEDGTESDVANASYAGNAMSEIPLVWIDQYESAGKEYIWLCETQYNEYYKAYAHTREDGTIADYFYWSMFGGSSIGNVLRSLSGKTLQNNVTTDTQIAQAKANGDGWYIHSWSQRNCIQSLLTLLCCNDDTQAAFGNGNCRTASDVSGVIASGTLNTSGQFGGSSSSTRQVKVFHIEQFWGNLWDRTAGLCNNAEGILVKMTPPYNTTGTGYVRTGIVMSGTPGGYISKTSMTQYGRLPVVVSGSGSTYVCDGAWFNNSQLNYALCGAGANDAAALGGAFAVGLDNAPANASWDIGAGLSCEMPAA